MPSNNNTSVVHRLNELSNVTYFYYGLIRNTGKPIIEDAIEEIANRSSRVGNQNVSRYVAGMLHSLNKEAQSCSSLFERSTIALWDILNEGIQRQLAQFIEKSSFFRAKDIFRKAKMSVAVYFANPLDALISVIDNLMKDKCSNTYGAERIYRLLNIMDIKPDGLSEDEKQYMRELHIVRNRLVHHDGRPSQEIRHLEHPLFSYREDKIIISMDAFSKYSESSITVAYKCEAAIRETEQGLTR